MHRLVQHSGGLCIPTIVLGELYAWAYHRQNPGSIIQRIENDLLPDVAVLDFDLASRSSTAATSPVNPPRFRVDSFGDCLKQVGLSD